MTRVASVFLLAALSFGASTAHAQDEPRLRWSDDWARVHPASYVVSTTATAASLFIDELFEPPDAPIWFGPILFDADVRRRVDAGEDEGREIAASVSDVLLAALLLWPIVDSVAVAGLGDMNSDVFWQLSMVHLEVVAADFVLGTLVKLFVDRQRPHGDRCLPGEDVSDPRRCGRRGVSRSFYSGHASAAFASAGNVCMSHAHVPLYGSTAGDAFGCGAAILTASIVGVLRIVADRHYATDVLMGAVVGLAIGLGLPYLLHYGWDPTDSVGSTPGPLTASAPAMLSYGGSF